MAETQLQINIGADTKDLAAALRQARKEIDDFEKKVGLVAPTSGKATQALGSLGRVASDLPFGFIAIGNNIEPLIQSFQSLGKASGGAKEALKAIGGSLVGPAGILLAFSVVSSAITVAIQKYGSLEKALNAALGKQTAFDKVVIKAADSLKKYNESIRSVNDAQVAGAASATGESQKIQALAAIVTDTTKSYNQRNEALRQLKEINKDYFSDIDIESGKLSTLKERVNQLTEARIQDAIAQEFATDIAKTTKEIGIQTEVLKGLKLQAAQAQSKLAAFNAEQERGGQVIPTASATTGISVDRTTRTQEALQAAINKANAAVADQKSKISELTKTNTGYRAALDAAVAKNTELNISIQATSKANRDNTETAKKNAEELKKQTEEVQRQAEARKKSLAEILDRGSKVQTIDFTSFFDLDPAQARSKYATLFAPVGSAFQEALAPSQGKLGRDFTIIPPVAIQAAIDNVNRLRDAGIQAGAAFSSVISPAIDGVFSAIENGQSVIKSLGDSFKKLVIDLIKATIKAAAFALVISAASGGTINFGTAFRGALQLGGTGGGFGGLRGAAAPTFGGVSGFGGGLQLAGQVVFTQRGTDLVGVLNNSNARINRVG